MHEVSAGFVCGGLVDGGGGDEWGVVGGMVLVRFMGRAETLVCGRSVN